LITSAATFVTLLTGFVALHNWHTSSQIEKATKESLPIRITRSISYSQLSAAMKQLGQVLDEDRFVPDLIVGIHYQGTAFAMILGKIKYIPVRHVEVEYIGEKDAHVCQNVTFPFNLDKLKGKRVLIIDNSERSGRTLRLVAEAVTKHAAKETRSVIVYRVVNKDNDPSKADYVLFYSRRRIRLLR
jgi:hypoxanthine phosphoribosyltransferase